MPAHHGRMQGADAQGGVEACEQASGAAVALKDLALKERNGVVG